MDRLLELQELDLSIDRLRSRGHAIESGEEARQARARMEEAEERVGELRLALDAVQKEEGRLEHDAASLTSRIDAEQKRLYDGSVANPKELEAIQHEVQSLTNRRGRIEDEQLGQMERREEMERRLPPLEKELEEARSRLAEIEATSETELAEIRQTLETRHAERQALAPALDEELLDLYDGLRKKKGGVGAAALRDGVCQGCHQKLSALELDRHKKADGLRRCEYCRRILIPE